MDSVEGGSFICWEVFLAPEALTRALKARASRGGGGGGGIWQIYVLSSAISCILTSDHFRGGMHCSLILALRKVIVILKTILKCSEMSVCN